MAEYVNKEEALKHCEALPKLYREAMRLFIKEMPSVNIVRCKECKYGDTGNDEDGNLFWKCIGIHYGGTEPDDFCNYGERE